MIADYIFNIDVNNDYSILNFKNKLYTGIYHVIIKGDLINAYYIISKFNILDNDPFINRLHYHSNVNIDIHWGMNEQIKIRTINNILNFSYRIEVKLYEL